MSDYRDNASQNHARPNFSARGQGNNAQARAANGEWYDQGFDFGDDQAASAEELAAYSINPNLLSSAGKQFREASKNQEHSDADDKLKEGTLDLKVDPLLDSSTLAVSNSHARRFGSTTVGGAGKIFDKDNARNANRASTMSYSPRYTGSAGPQGSVYSDDYLFKQELKEESSANGGNSLYGNSSFIGQRIGERNAHEQAKRRDLGGASQYQQNSQAKNMTDSALSQQQLKEMRKRQLREQQERFEKVRLERERQKQQILMLQREQRMQVSSDSPRSVFASSARPTPSRMMDNRAPDKRERIWNEARLALEAIGASQGNKSTTPYKPKSTTNAFAHNTASRGIPAGMATMGADSKTPKAHGYQPQFDDPAYGNQLYTNASRKMQSQSSSTNATYNHYQEQQKAKGNVQKGPVDETTRSHASRMSEQRLNQRNGAKDNSEKTLEELAREYPGLSPEHLIKLKRSSNRCHLVSRTPIFDANSAISMYELKFTAGKLFQVNALKSEHVYHVLFGYFIRRGVSCFIGRRANVLVMMPITYDLLDYLERYSVNRVILRICPEQPVSPSALHILTKLRRSGMSFAIDLMLLLKKDWNKAVLSIEYVMIDLSSKIQEQLHVFQRLKVKAPWLKTIGYNDTNGDGYTYLARHMIDFLDAPFWNPRLSFNHDLSFFAPMLNEVVPLIHELFKLTPNFNIFQTFLSKHDDLSRDMAVFLYRFRHASPRQVQNASDLYQYLLDSSANRSFSILAGRALMMQYVKSLPLSQQFILQEQFSQAIIRGFFCEYLTKVFDDPYLKKFGFQAGMFSLLHLFLLKEEVDVIADDSFADIYDRIYESELMTDIIDCVTAIETTNLTGIFNFIQKYKVPPASVLISHEKAIMRTNELLLVLNLAYSKA